MMAGNPNWWSMNGMHPRDSSPFGYPPSDDHGSSDGQDFPARSWSQLLLDDGGGGGGDDVYGGGLFQQQKKLESWEEPLVSLNINKIPSPISRVSDDVKLETGYGGVPGEDDFPAAGASNCVWPPPLPPSAIPASSPTSCITNSILNFSSEKNQQHSSESTSGVYSKKARVEQSSAQPAFKVRKEKFGDRITALHQLVAPFGKTDTASVLLEAIGYIRFLQDQIEALSSPYMRHTGHGHHHPSLLNGIGMETGASNQGSDLRIRGLCLVPISCGHHMATSDGANYWPPAAVGGGFHLQF